MAIDCIIDYNCNIKKALTLDRMISMIKNRDHAAAAVHKYCKICPASRGKRFSCYTAISYPISRKAESWLVDLSRKALEKGAPDSIILNYILDKKVAGGAFDRMRKDPGVFFEFGEPLEISISKGLLRKKAVNTNQILNILFGTGRMKNPLIMMLLYFSGGLLIQQDEPKRETVRHAVKITDKNRKEYWMAFHLEDRDTDDSSIFMLKEFFRALFIAYGLDREMVIGI